MPPYLIVFEKGDSSYAAYSPDVPGCVATGETVEQTVEEIKSALGFHFKGLAQDGERIPSPQGIEFHCAESRKTGEPFVEPGDFMVYILAESVLPGNMPVAA